jgi:hypothetical protein
MPKPSWPKYSVIKRIENKERTTVEKTLIVELSATLYAIFLATAIGIFLLSGKTKALGSCL